MFWNRPKPAPTASEAARILSDEARAQKARKAATLERLRNCVATGRIAHLGWKA